MPTQNILVSTELSGLCLNDKYIDFLYNRVENKITELQETAYKLMGQRFNFQSSKCISQVCYDIIYKYRLYTTVITSKTS